MKTRAKRASKNKSAVQIKSDVESIDAVMKKPTLAVVNSDEVVSQQSAVRPKVHTYPKRIKEVVRTEMKAANSNLPEITMPGAVDLDAPENHVATDMNNPPSTTRFDWNFTIWLAALVVAVNLALLMLVGSPSKPVSEKLYVTAPVSEPVEAGVVVKGMAAEEPTTALVVKATTVATKPTVAPVASVATVAPAPTPIMVAVPVAKPTAIAPTVGKPVPDLLSIINQNN